LNQNKVSRLHQLAVYIFSYVVVDFDGKIFSFFEKCFNNARDT
jgi:hypothetical protein